MHVTVLDQPGGLAAETDTAVDDFGVTNRNGRIVSALFDRAPVVRADHGNELHGVGLGTLHVNGCASLGGKGKAVRYFHDRSFLHRQRDAIGDGDIGENKVRTARGIPNGIARECAADVGGVRWMAQRQERKKQQADKNLENPFASYSWPQLDGRGRSDGVWCKQDGKHSLPYRISDMSWKINWPH